MADKRPEPPSVDDINPEDLVRLGGGRLHTISATLRFFGDDLEPDDVTRQLGCRPTSSIRKGEPLPGRYRRVADTGHWLLSGSATDVPSTEDAIMKLLQSLPSDTLVWNELTARFSADIFCGVSLENYNGVLELSNPLLRELTSRNLPLKLDVYGPDPPS